MRKLFTLEDAWSGGDFGLLLFLGNVSKASVKTALCALWDHLSLDGCWVRDDVEPEDQPRVAAADWKDGQEPILYGVATLPNKNQCNCRSIILSYDDGIWLYLGTPMGGLARSYPVGGYPFNEGSDVPWMMPMSEWLADIARSIFADYPFKLGFTGFEVNPYQVDYEGEIPMERWDGWLRNECGTLGWYPPNILKAPFSFNVS